jgi:hypothetical protein
MATMKVGRSPGFCFRGEAHLQALHSATVCKKNKLYPPDPKWVACVIFIFSGGPQAHDFSGRDEKGRAATFRKDSDSDGQNQERLLCTNCVFYNGASSKPHGRSTKNKGL